jgi:hypothetical protein
MLKHPGISTLFATVYLLVYILLLQLETAPNISLILFFFSPIVLIALAYSIIRYGKYDGRELEEKEHWGYQDRPEKKSRITVD